MSEKQHHMVAAVMLPDLDRLLDRTIAGEDVKMDFKSAVLVFRDQTELYDRLKAAGCGVHFFVRESGGTDFPKALVGARFEASKSLLLTALREALRGF